MLETGEALIEFLQCFEVSDDSLVVPGYSFARHQHGNPGGIRHQHAGGDPGGVIFEFDVFHLVADDFLVGFRRGHDRFRIGVGGFVQMVDQFQFAHHVMHGLAQFLQGHFCIFGRNFHQRRDRLGDPRAAVVQPFEFQQAFHQRSPFALGGADREQNQQRVVSGSGDFGSPVIQEFGHDVSGDAHLPVLAVRRDAGAGDGHFDRVEHTVRILDIFPRKAVPLCVRLQRPAGGLAAQQVERGVFKRIRLAGFGVPDFCGLQDVEEPVLGIPFADFALDAHDGFAEGDGVFDRLLHQIVP
ncbi:hypothetical protein SDC9_125311 [bioreactor metagenome]|uniref:Uncharacterized protein n=1 Tax=bioreactor metagenome TaxID=1076179 RepID=A0A645CMM1_9ZZZZ